MPGTGSASRCRGAQFGSREAGSVGGVGRELAHAVIDVEPRVARLLEAMLEGMLA